MKLCISEARPRQSRANQWRGMRGFFVAYFYMQRLGGHLSSGHDDLYGSTFRGIPYRTRKVTPDLVLLLPLYPIGALGDTGNAVPRHVVHQQQFSVRLRPKPRFFSISTTRVIGRGHAYPLRELQDADHSVWTQPPWATVASSYSQSTAKGIMKTLTCANGLCGVKCVAGRYSL